MSIYTPNFNIQPYSHNNSSITFENSSGSTLAVIIIASIFGGLVIGLMCLYFLCRGKKPPKINRWRRPNQVVDIDRALHDMGLEPTPTPTVLRDQFYDNDINDDN